MHEWALAEAVVSSIENIFKDASLRESSTIRLKVGELQQIDLDILKFAIQEILKAQKAGINPAIEISVEKALLRCRTCGEEWGFEKRRDRLDMVKLESIHFLPEAAKAYLRCPCCKSPDFEVAKGRGIWIEEIKTE